MADDPLTATLASAVAMVRAELPSPAVASAAHALCLELATLLCPPSTLTLSSGKRTLTESDEAEVSLSMLPQDMLVRVAAWMPSIEECCGLALVGKIFRGPVAPLTPVEQALARERGGRQRGGASWVEGHAAVVAGIQ